MSIDLRPNCVAQWKMNDTSGTTVVDSMGLHNGTSANAVVPAVGKIGGALSFNGTSDYIDTGRSFQSTFRSDFTVCFWAKPTDGRPDSTSLYYFNAANVPLNDIDLALRTDGKFKFECLAGGLGNFVLSSNALDNGSQPWHFVLFSARQVSVRNATLLICVNDIINTRENVVMDLVDFTSANNATLGISASYVCDGAIDNVMIFNKALGQEEIAFLWNGGTGTEALTNISNKVYSRMNSNRVNYSPKTYSLVR